MNNRKGVLIIVAVLAGAFLLRRWESRQESVREPSLPPAQAPAAAAATPVSSGPAPVEKTPVAPVATLTPEERAVADIEKHIQLALKLSQTPDLDDVMAVCMENPRLTAEQYDLKVPEPPSVSGEISSMLCRRDNAGCSKLEGWVPLKTTPGDCKNPPCGLPLFLSAAESMGQNPSDCTLWTAWLLTEAEALEGRGDSYCRSLLPVAIPELGSSDPGPLCKLLGSDIRNGSYDFCKTIVAKPPPGNKWTMQDCVRPMEGYLKGMDGCLKGEAGKNLKFDQPSCPLQVRVREALQTGDVSKCHGDPLCAAFLSPAGCEPERFVDFRNPSWGRICDAAVSYAQINWIKQIEDQGQGTVDALTNYRKQLPQSPEAQAAKLGPRLDKAIASLKRALKLADKRRVEMNEGKLQAAHPRAK